MLIKFVGPHLSVNNANTSTLHEIICSCYVLGWWPFHCIPRRKGGEHFTALTITFSFVKGLLWDYFNVIKSEHVAILPHGKNNKKGRQKDRIDPRFARNVTIYIYWHVVSKIIRIHPTLKRPLVKRHMKSFLTCLEEATTRQCEFSHTLQSSKHTEQTDRQRRLSSHHWSSSSPVRPSASPNPPPVFTVCLWRLKCMEILLLVQYNRRHKMELNNKQ